MPGIAVRCAGGLLRQGEATFAEFFNDPAQAQLVESAGKSGSKNAFAEYAKTVNATATLPTYLPEVAIDAIRLSKELRRGVKSAMEVERTTARASNVRASTEAKATQVVERDLAEERDNDERVDWLSFFLMLVATLLEPPEFLTTHLD